MQLSVFRLQPHGAFHFGVQGIDMESVLETCPSDTLYAALTWHAIQRGDSWARDASNTAPTPPFCVSSCFPYVNDIQLLPLPLLPPQKDEEQQRGERKKFKNIRFVSLDVFKHLLHGGSLRVFFAADRGAFLQNGKVLVSKPELDRSGWNTDHVIWQHEAIPHVSVDRVSNASAYYETAQIRFNGGCGLSVLANGDAATLLPLLQDVGISGLGGRRSKGVGQFEVEQHDSIDLPSNTSERLILLSRYLPTRPELERGVLGNLAAYSLEDVTGWLYAPGTRAQRRQNIWMLAAGSTIQRIDSLKGDIVDLKPQYANQAGEPIHPIWRHGLALTVGAPLQEAS